jgi:signal transduction histidine kinase
MKIPQIILRYLLLKEERLNKFNRFYLQSDIRSVAYLGLAVGVILSAILPFDIIDGRSDVFIYFRLLFCVLCICMFFYARKASFTIKQFTLFKASIYIFSAGIYFIKDYISTDHSLSLANFITIFLICTYTAMGTLFLQTLFWNLLVFIAFVAYTLFVDHQNHYLTDQLVAKLADFGIITVLGFNLQLLRYSYFLQYQYSEEEKSRFSSLNTIKSKLLAIIAHDLKSPVHSLKAITGLMRMEALSQKEQAELTAEVEHKVNDVNRLIENLLYWANAQMDGAKLAIESISLSAAVDTVKNLVSTIYKHKNINLKVEVNPQIFVEADAQALQIIIRNLLANAYKFSSENSYIHLRAAEEKGLVTTAITDTGVGISAERIHKLFNVASTTEGTSSERGTGLGLLVCKEYINLQGGKIWVESTEGEGSTFYFCLPSSAKSAVLLV